GGSLRDRDARPDVHGLGVGARLELQHAKRDTARDQRGEHDDGDDDEERPPAASAGRQLGILGSAGVRWANLAGSLYLRLHPPSLGFGRNRPLSDAHVRYWSVGYQVMTSCRLGSKPAERESLTAASLSGRGQT